MKKLLLNCLLLICVLSSFAQKDSTRKVPAVRTATPVKIDGVLNDMAWKAAPVADKFIEWRPNAGKPEDEKNKTEVFITYDDEAIYVGGYCHEANIDSISKELVGRDVVGVNDFIGVIFDTYLDQINGFGYYVTVLNEQFDAKYSSGDRGEDPSWNSVFQSATQMQKDGWTFEMRIPYSAIRFSKKDVQNWGFNITRRRSKSGQQFMWNAVDPQKTGFLNQFGQWTGIKDIKPPLRLSFSPYFSTYLNHFPHNKPGVKNLSTQVNGGMDVKYGINKAFTLDMTLIPDFGQVQSDNQVLNLTPFEVRYNENRTFFTEGTELFNKGELFYSRRIGGQPLHFYDVYGKAAAEGKTVVKNPSETKLINATKISGRTASGLGIGVFNAVTKPTHAILEDASKQQYEVETNPLTNYNILVFDQTMKNNSSVSLVNTNVMRSGNDYDANVTAALWDIYDKKVNWNFWGKVATSQLSGQQLPTMSDETGKQFSMNSGYQYNLNFGKFKGPFNFQVYRQTADQRFYIADMGYLTNNNYLNHGFWTGYKITKPHGFYNRLYFNVNFSYSQRYKPRAYQNVFINTNVNGQLKNLANVGLGMNINPQEWDFYEARTPGRVFKRPASWAPRYWYYSNEAKKYSFGIEGGVRITKTFNGHGEDFYIFNQYRFNKKFSVYLNTFLEFRKNNAGYAFRNGSDVVFGLRDRHTVENVLNAKYNFNNKMGLNFRLRHYWSKVDFTKFYILNPDGYMSPEIAPVAGKNPDNNFNVFNIDMVYTWQFAQGSFLNIGWKDQTSLFNQDIETPYFKNFRNTLNESQLNSFSVKVIYYLDYLDLKKKKIKS